MEECSPFSWKGLGLMMKRLCYLHVVFVLALGWSVNSMAETYSIQPVGKVVKRSGKTMLEIFPAFKDGLLGLDGFSHVQVYYWFDRNDSPDKRATLRVHPRGDKANPLTGVFATRSPVRPNLIGYSVCRIRSVEGNKIIIENIDAFDGSPIIDLKPYMPASDCVPDASVPDWVKR
jgi:tRNA (adenine37-N6)-methyltransferase